MQPIADNDLTIDDVENVLADPVVQGRSRSTNRPAVWGYSLDGRYVIVIFEEIDQDTIRPVTAYEVEEP